MSGLAGGMAQAARETTAEWRALASDGRPVDVAEAIIRFTRTVVVRALLGADLGPLAAKIDEAWVIINQQVGESFWALGIAERFKRAKARRFEAARTVVLRDAVDYVITERTPAPSVRQQHSPNDSDSRTRSTSSVGRWAMGGKD